MKSLTEYMRGVESKKRSLEDEVDKLNEDIAQLKTTEPTSFISADEDSSEVQVRV